ncbi:hypothetical protein SUGI_0221820 [Cryptomeria japonica]|nr:hypothetical protein SUGI_0221820 [Cryptomeria japonica]
MVRGIRYSAETLAAVGIEKTVKEVLDLLEAQKNSLLGVAIYGFGGMGKTIVAKAVVAKMNIDDYNYSSIYIFLEQNCFKSLQQQILRVFPIL